MPYFVTHSTTGNLPGAANGPVQADLARLKDLTGKIVGSVFFGTMLKAMRESATKGRFGHGGRGEEIFAAQLHGVLAEKAGARAGGSGNVLYRRLERQQALISAGQFKGEVLAR